MPVEVLMPALSPTMTDGKILSWKKKKGDSVDTSTVIAEIETDKAVMELEAPCKGTLSEIININLDQQVKVGTLIAVIMKKNETEKDVEEFIKNYHNNNAVNNTADNRADNVAKDISTGISQNFNEKEQKINEQKILCEKKDIQDIKISSCTDNLDRKKISPLAKKIASEHNINFNSISAGSGPMGRIIKEDIERIIETSSSSGRVGGIFANQIKRNQTEFYETQSSSMRKAIASRLSYSKQQIPHFYVSFDVEINKLLQIREEMNKVLSVNYTENGKPRYKISINDMIVKAVACAIERNPKINSSWEEGKIINYNNIDICVAVAIENGLITPIVRNCNQKGIITISEEIKDLAKRAKEGKLKNNEYQGGGITISNLGNYPHISSFAGIINPPQASILSVATVQDRPIVKNNQVVVAKICQMQISADHRILDGADIAKFTFDIKDIIENTALSLIL